ncbi:hypothetical protein PSACC_01836 [Paramicrosporidium saccamoebae]|uniref:Protein kinase domain-containing protein n=1 Tax=Paramicrosporidium saccamoebae TaxID=1246581 RepID=A0A2H9TKT9_9FUNG|nr:hypothetical protein PSACC_01836 [Paramicrosporidium saccamoebae]
MTTFPRLVRLFTNVRFRRLVVSGTTVVVGAGACAYYWPEIAFFGRTVGRATRTAFTVGLISLDYKRHFPRAVDLHPLGEEEWRRRRNKVHMRGAQRLLLLFQQNGGIYIKVGQHLAALEYILPPEYSSKMAVLQNAAPQSSLAEVAHVILDEFGCPMHKVFSTFDVTPIGAASLAQVHRAVLRDTGEEVAVKVQHRRLQSHMDSDMFVIATAVKVVRRIFPEFDLNWVAEEMKTNLPKELDFVHEGHNSERLLKNLQHYGRTSLSGPGTVVRIPKVHWDFTSKRVLTMEYLPGAKATDRRFMEQNSIDPHQVSSLITQVFSEMIFIHGFVHCDPHPGNLLVRPRPLSSGWSLFRLWRQPFELVVIDHGLYRELSDVFRHDFAGLWKSVLEADEVQMKHYAERLGGGDAHRLFSCILTQRSWQTISTGGLVAPRSASERAEILAKAPEYLGQVAELLARVPRQLLLVLKTNDLLRHLERALARPDEPSRTFTIMAHYCLDVVGDSFLRRCYLHLKLYLLDIYLRFLYKL